MAVVANIAVDALRVRSGASYRRYRVRHTLGLLFAGFLLLQNSLWIYLYMFDSQFIGWFYEGEQAYQLSVVGLCGLQTIARRVSADYLAGRWDEW